MAARHRITLDAMGGDNGPTAVVPAALKALERHGEALELILVGSKAAINDELAKHRLGRSSRVRVHDASQVIAMDEAPSQALRFKKDSSMRVAIDLVKAGEADVCISAGNTGALMATARYVLKTLPGVDRPAICTTLPCQGGRFRLLDLGANVDCTAEHLFQFGVMGSVLVSALDGIERPRVGLLNLGEEEIKGNEQVKRASQLLHDSPLNYIGYAEGDSMYEGAADVVVCDGFTGNVALKSSEGVAHFISAQLREAFRRNLFSRVAGLVAWPVLKGLRRRLDPRRYNGASLLGLRGIVVKSHGDADALAFEEAIEMGVLEASNNVPSLISQRVGELFAAEQG